MGMFWIALWAVSSTWAGEIPDCIGDQGRPLEVDNAQVLNWKANTPNAFQARGHVRGPVTRVFPLRNGHDHFEISLGSAPGQVLEVVYNQSFGTLPEIREGMVVQACGDYITSVAQTGPYPPSPSGAIIHWVHFNPRNAGHPHGFVVVDGLLYGMREKGGGGKPRRPQPRILNDFFEEWTTPAY